MDATVIDSHVHVWPSGLLHPAQTTDEPLAATPADLLATIDDSGVDVALMSPANVYRQNPYVLGASDATPDRLLAVVSADPRDGEGIERIADHAAFGAAAVRVNLGADTLDDAALSRLDELAAAVASADVVLQWTMKLPSAHLIEHVAARHPRLPQVLDHLGLPVDATDLDQLAVMRSLAGIEHLHIKLSGMYALSTDGYPYEDVWPWMEGTVEAFGAERTLWASDWPLSMRSASHRDLLALVGRLPFLDEAARAEVLGGTARRLWPAMA